jgi:hypothetical protein
MALKLLRLHPCNTITHISCNNPLSAQIQVSFHNDIIIGNIIKYIVWQIKKHRIGCSYKLTHILIAAKEGCCQDVCVHDAEDYAYVWFVMDRADIGIELPFHIPLVSDEADFPASGNRAHILCNETDHTHLLQNSTMADPLHL